MRLKKNAFIIYVTCIGPNTKSSYDRRNRPRSVEG
jgi:hypothetical protein